MAKCRNLKRFGEFFVKNVGGGEIKLEFIVPINSNSEIRLRRVKYATRVKFAHRASEIRPLGGCRKKPYGFQFQL